MSAEEKIVIQDLRETPKRHVRVLLGQIATTPDDWMWRPEHHLYFPKDTEVFHKKIESIVAEAANSTVDLIVLPELSVPLGCLDSLKNWSEKYGGIAIAGSHYHHTKSLIYNRCPICIAGCVFFTEKLNPSPIERSPFKDRGLSRGSVVHVFKNTKIGNFAALICSDYLFPKLRQTVLDHQIDLLCVPAFQKDSRDYHAVMGVNCKESELGLYLAYSNMVCAALGDGRSAFFAITDRLYSEQFKKTGITDLSPEQKVCELSKSQEWIILEADLKNRRPQVPHKPNTEPNVNVVRYHRIPTFYQQPDLDESDLLPEPGKNEWGCFKHILILNQVRKIALQGGASCAVVYGGPGIGKSAIAVRAYYDDAIVAHFGKRRIFVRCDGLLSIRELIMRLGTKLGIPATTSSLEESLDVAPTFIVLDDISGLLDAGAKNIATLISTRLHRRTVSLLVTTQANDPPSEIGSGDNCFKPGALDLPAAIDVFEHFAPPRLRGASKDVLEYELEPLLKQMDGLPLAIKLLGGAANGYGDIAGLRDAWENHDVKVFRREPLDAALRFSMMSQLTSETPESRGVLRLLALLPDGILEEDLLALWPDGRRRIAPLVTLALLSYETSASGRRIRFLTPIRKHLCNKYRPSDKQLLRLADHYLRVLIAYAPKLGTQNGGAARSRLVPEALNIETMMLLLSQLNRHSRTSTLEEVEAYERLVKYTGHGSIRPLSHTN